MTTYAITTVPAQALVAHLAVLQMLCGIAKDLTKLGGKTVTKLVTPDEKQSKLFKLVSLITGWKNSLKGTAIYARGSLKGPGPCSAAVCMLSSGQC